MISRRLIMMAGPAAFALPKPVPRMQALPVAGHQISFQRDGVELTRYHYDSRQERTFLYPVNGPSGISLTRMGHPRDPHGHSHHNSFWVSHRELSGLNFWEDRRNTGKVSHVRLIRLDDSATECSIEVENVWSALEGMPVMAEVRRIGVRTLERGEWLLTLDLTFQAKHGEVKFSKTPFGMAGVRMAKTMGVNDGGGVLRNSEGAEDEPGILWKRARWVDYSGPVKNGVEEGITLFDHPSNPNHPTYFHVRRDGWMGTSFSYDEEKSIAAGDSLRLRHALYVHAGRPPAESIEDVWKQYARGT